MTTTAGQLLYGNVEKDRSPDGRAGFQTLARTSGLITQADVDEIEPRLFYFPTVGDPVKRVFFVTPSGKAVVAQVVPVTDRDRGGRAGLTFAHAVVFAPDAFAVLGADPVAVFDAVPFCRSWEEAQNRLRPNGNEVGEVAVPRSDAPEDASELVAWDAAQLSALASAALAPPGASGRAAALALTGPPDRIEAVLRSLFRLVPRAWRSGYTFDMHFVRGNLSATPYRIVGVPTQAPAGEVVPVDVLARRVSGPAAGDERAFTRWLLAQIRAGAVAQAVEFREAAFALAEHIDGRARDVAPELPPAVAAAVVGANRAAATNRARSRLAERLPRPLADRLSEWPDALPDADLVDLIRNSVPAARLHEALYAAYVRRGFAAPPVGEQAALRDIGDGRLELLAAVWSGDRDRFRAGTEEEAVYREAVTVGVRGGLQPTEWFYGPGRAGAFLDAVAEAGSARAFPLVELIEAFLEGGDAAHTPRLIPWLRGADRRTLESIRDRLARRAEIPEEFAAAVEEAVASLPEPLLRKAWRRLFGRTKPEPPDADG